MISGSSNMAQIKVKLQGTNKIFHGAQGNDDIFIRWCFFKMLYFQVDFPMTYMSYIPHSEVSREL